MVSTAGSVTRQRGEIREQFHGLGQLGSCSGHCLRCWTGCSGRQRRDLKWLLRRRLRLRAKPTRQRVRRLSWLLTRRGELAWAWVRARG